MTIQDLHQCLQKEDAFASVTRDAFVGILHVFHDIGDVLWFDSNPESALAQTVLSEEMYEIVRDEGRVAHRLLRRLKLWSDVDANTLLWLKTLLHQFNLAHPANKTKMMPNSDLIIPLYWKTTKPLIAMDTMPERAYWEYIFRSYLPENVFEKLGALSYSAHYSSGRRFGCDWFEAMKPDKFHSRVSKDTVTVDGALCQAVVIDVRATERDIMWEQLTWYCLSTELLLEEYPGLFVTRHVVSMDTGRRWDVNMLLDQQSRLKERGGNNVAAMDGDLLPPNMDWYMDRQQVLQVATASSALDDTQLVAMVQSLYKKMDAFAEAHTNMIAGIENHSLYPAFWSLQ